MKQVSYNFVFFLAALQSIPRSLIEAAADRRRRAGPALSHLILPLIGPTTFFLSSSTSSTRSRYVRNHPRHDRRRS